ncbi:CCA tRNA nucleotidyltransferase [Paenibacillus sp. JX-17]|uniref:CCA tRNA nucleotidyltransferase n=1 Tax=Paenibacillus lacisoli TaxID=3064525 RepID=A0ABT9CBH0_9BACL|nr:CCA tRNA nucleotidyltransferase [Paenibacillus sp. JX-17]MDO7905036.1 CCA tRNA nucleotidyltransferase [Paenibacillus sp. JX-17]
MKVWRHVPAQMAAQGEKVVRTLVEAGHQAYWVGGCVRDELMGREVHDMDITTSAMPQQVTELFPGSIPTGIQHGTITVVIEGIPFEVTTFRTEGEYEDHRRPTEVHFVTDVAEDLRRRDFTMNAIAIGLDGQPVDPFNGREDIQQRLIRCVGEAQERFDEDGLRMVRCVRFASVFQFRIALNTWKGLLHQRDKLGFIAAERIRTELEKMMKGPAPLRGLELLRRSRLISYARIQTSWERIAAADVSSLPLLGIDHRWMLLLFAMGLEPDEADQLLREWTFSNRQRERWVAVLRWEKELQRLVLNAEPGFDPGHAANRKAWIGMVLRFGQQTAEDWLTVRELKPEPLSHEQKQSSGRSEAGETENGFNWREWTLLGWRWNREIRLFGLKELAVGGSDLLAELQLKGGPWLGQLMQHLLLETASGDLQNSREELIEEARRVISRNEA